MTDSDPNFGRPSFYEGSHLLRRDVSFTMWKDGLDSPNSKRLLQKVQQIGYPIVFQYDPPPLAKLKQTKSWPYKWY